MLKFLGRTGGASDNRIHSDALAAALELEAAWGPPPLTLVGYLGGN